MSMQMITTLMAMWFNAVAQSKLHFSEAGGGTYDGHSLYFAAVLPLPTLQGHYELSFCLGDEEVSVMGVVVTPGSEAHDTYELEDTDREILYDALSEFLVLMDDERVSYADEQYDRPVKPRVVAAWNELMDAVRDARRPYNKHALALAKERARAAE